VIISCDEPLKFEPVDGNPNLGILKVPEREGILRAIDGQHRLLALHAGMEQFEGENFTVPAVIFDGSRRSRGPDVRHDQREAHAPECFASGVAVGPAAVPRRQPGGGARRRARAQREGRLPLYGEIKLLGVGHGRVAQAPLAQELKRLFASDAFGQGKKAEAFREDARKFFINYFRQVSVVFGAAWNGRKYSIRSANALRAFIRVAPEIVERLDQQHADRSDFRAIGRIIAPWGRRIGDLRFETAGAWKRSNSTVDQLAKELRLALQYPDGAMV
jgi:hypothetical protein